MSDFNLKPCPFCGGDDLKVQKLHYKCNYGEILDEFYFVVGCRDGDCFITGPTSDISADDAVNKWNERGD